MLLLLVLFGWMGQWGKFVLLVWLALGMAGLSRAGERLVVAAGFGFRRPTPAQASTIEPVWAAAIDRAGLDEAELDLYVQRSCEANAYAAGSRSIAVTSTMLRDLVAHRLDSAEAQAVLMHEFGHHATRATRFALVSLWIALPWRLAARLVIGVGLATVGRRQPTWPTCAVVVAGVVVAVVQAFHERQFAVAVMLFMVGVCAAVCPLADAWASRRSEYAADRYAAQHGAGPALVSVLRRFDSQAGSRRGWTQQLLSRHPPVERRVAAIERLPLARLRVDAQRPE